jgi:hypothetical protein
MTRMSRAPKAFFPQDIFNRIWIRTVNLELTFSGLNPEGSLQRRRATLGEQKAVRVSAAVSRNRVSEAL